jgi:PBP1b-binding outer membrane lipoprotein LpoB
MKKNLYFIVIISTLLFVRCGGGSEQVAENKDNSKELKTETPAENLPNVEVPNIDLEALKDEKSILEAMEKVVNGRLEDDKLSKENPQYKGKYVEFTKLYSAVLKKSTEFQKTLPDAKSRVAFNEKIQAITDKMYKK